MKYKITTQEELDKINEEYYKYYPNEKDKKFSGCNYYVNTGNIWTEPIGTATSMHNCDEMICEKFNKCKLIKNNPVWFWNDDIEKEFNRLWKEMIN